MLITCPECEQSISDKALSCPHCGYPLAKDARPKSRPKRMKLPNGFGRITEIKGKNLRKPFRAMVTCGKDEEGRPKGCLLRPVAYFATYNEAYAALMEYNKSPYDLSSKTTVNELFEKWFPEYEKGVVAKRAKDMKRVWSYCEDIHDIDVTVLRPRMIRDLLDSSGKSGSIKTQMKTVITMVLDYGVEYEYVTRNCAKDVKNKGEATSKEDSHHAFTSEEFAVISSHLDDPVMALIYINCYTGFRPSELCEIEVSKVNLSDWFITGGSKTTSGKNRVVPIHKNIKDLIREKYNKALSAGKSRLILSPTNDEMTYNTYYHRFQDVAKKYNLGTSHKPHDCRKQFVTMAKKAGMDEYALKRIIGHNIKDLTESVYTERDVVWLHKELAKIP